MRRTACDDLKVSVILEFPEGLRDVPVITVHERVLDAREFPIIMKGGLMELRHEARALDLFIGELDQFIEVADITVLEERVAEHRHKRRREGHRKAPRHMIPFESFEHVDKRNVGFGDGFIKPELFEKIFVLGVAYEGKVRVEDYGKKAFFHSLFLLPFLEDRGRPFCRATDDRGNDPFFDAVRRMGVAIEDELPVGKRVPEREGSVRTELHGTALHGNRGIRFRTPVNNKLAFKPKGKTAFLDPDRACHAGNGPGSGTRSDSTLQAFFHELPELGGTFTHLEPAGKRVHLVPIDRHPLFIDDLGHSRTRRADLIGAREARKTAVTVEQSDLNDISVVRVGIDVPALRHVLKSDIKIRRIVRSACDIENTEDGAHAVPTASDFCENFFLMVFLNLPVRINPVRIAHEKIDLIVTVIIGKFAAIMIERLRLWSGRYLKGRFRQNRHFGFDDGLELARQCGRFPGSPRGRSFSGDGTDRSFGSFFFPGTFPSRRQDHFLIFLKRYGLKIVEEAPFCCNFG